MIWGGKGGFEVDNVGRLRWLAEADILYWGGDIDTHGFAILDRLRAWLPRARSVLMDRETLLTHRDRWVTEDRSAKSVLTRLTPDERDLYSELVGGRIGGIEYASSRSESTGIGSSNGYQVSTERGFDCGRKQEVPLQARL